MESRAMGSYKVVYNDHHFCVLVRVLSLSLFVLMMELVLVVFGLEED